MSDESGGGMGGEVLETLFVDLKARLDGLESNLKGGLSQVEKAAEESGKKAGSLFHNAFTVATGNLISNLAQQAIGGFFQFIKDGVQGVQTGADAVQQINTAIESTGNKAGVSSQHLQDYANTVQLTTKFTQENAMATQAMLLTFTNIGAKGGVFDQATATALDMSQALGQDTKNSAIQLGKALNDPITGISSLQRVGVTFTDSQKQLIASLVKTGDVAGAQKVILAELNKEFGGSATAAGQTFSGQLELAKNALGEVGESIAGSLMPYIEKFVSFAVAELPKIGQTVQTVADDFQAGFGWVVNNLLPLIMPAIQRVVSVFKDFGGQASTSISPIKDALAKLWQQAQPLLQSLGNAWANAFEAAQLAWNNVLKPVLVAIWPIVQAVFGAILPFLQGIFDTIGKLFHALSALFKGDWSGAWNYLVDTVKTLGQTLWNLVQKVWDGIVEATKNLGPALKKWWDNAWGKIVDGFSATKDILKLGALNLFSGLLESLEKMLPDWLGFGKKLVQNLIDGVKQQKAAVAQELNTVTDRSQARNDMATVGPVAGAKVSANFTSDKASSILAASKILGINPNDLAAVISFETAGTFSPKIVNPKSGATGLIQFMPNTAKDLGTSTAALAGMTFDQQIEYVIKYLKSRGINPGSKTDLGSLYNAVLGSGYKRGTPAYDQNPGLDVNNNGVIDPGEAVVSAKFKAHRADYFPDYSGSPSSIVKASAPPPAAPVTAANPNPTPTFHPIAAPTTANVGPQASDQQTKLQDLQLKYQLKLIGKDEVLKGLSDIESQGLALAKKGGAGWEDWGNLAKSAGEAIKSITSGKGAVDVLQQAQAVFEHSHDVADYTKTLQAYIAQQTELRAKLLKQGDAAGALAALQNINQAQAALTSVQQTESAKRQQLTDSEAGKRAASLNKTVQDESVALGKLELARTQALQKAGNNVSARLDVEKDSASKMLDETKKLADAQLKSDKDAANSRYQQSMTDAAQYTGQVRKNKETEAATILSTDLSKAYQSYYGSINTEVSRGGALVKTAQEKVNAGLKLATDALVTGVLAPGKLPLQQSLEELIPQLPKSADGVAAFTTHMQHLADQGLITKDVLKGILDLIPDFDALADGVAQSERTLADIASDSNGYADGARGLNETLPDTKKNFDQMLSSVNALGDKLRDPDLAAGMLSSFKLMQDQGQLTAKDVDTLTAQVGRLSSGSQIDDLKKKFADGDLSASDFKDQMNGLADGFAAASARFADLGNQPMAEFFKKRTQEAHGLAVAVQEFDPGHSTPQLKTQDKPDAGRGSDTPLVTVAEGGGPRKATTPTLDFADTARGANELEDGLKAIEQIDLTQKLNTWTVGLKKLTDSELAAALAVAKAKGDYTAYGAILAEQGQRTQDATSKAAAWKSTLDQMAFQKWTAGLEKYTDAQLEQAKAAAIASQNSEQYAAVMAEINKRAQEATQVWDKLAGIFSQVGQSIDSLAGGSTILGSLANAASGALSIVSQFKSAQASFSSGGLGGLLGGIGGWVGIVTSAISLVGQLGETFTDLLNPGLREFQKEMAKAAQEMAQVAQQTNTDSIFGKDSNPFSKALEEASKSADKLANAGFWQRLAWDVFGGAPQALSEAAKDALEQSAELFSSFAQSFSDIFVSTFTAALTNGKMADFGKNFEKQFKKAVVLEIVKVITESAIKTGVLGQDFKQLTDDVNAGNWSAVSSDIDKIVADANTLATGATFSATSRASHFLPAGFSTPFASTGLAGVLPPSLTGYLNDGSDTPTTAVAGTNGYGSVSIQAPESISSAQATININLLGTFADTLKTVLGTMQNGLNAASNNLTAAAADIRDAARMLKGAVTGGNTGTDWRLSR